MFRTMFERAGATDFALSTVAVVDGDLPAHVDDYDGYLVTGSAAGVYDDFDWIAPLMVFLRDAHPRRQASCRCCFGHQVIAHAQRRTYREMARRLGFGVYEVSLDGAPSWMPSQDSVRLIHIHQDQVVAVRGMEH